MPKFRALLKAFLEDCVTKPNKKGVVLITVIAGLEKIKQRET